MLDKKRKDIIERISKGGDFGFTDLEKLDKEYLADIILAYDLEIWLNCKEEYHELSLKVADCIRDYWKED